MQVFGDIGALQVPCPFATGEVRDTMTLISMRREVQGQGHSQTTLPLPMQTWRGLLMRFPRVLTFALEKLPCDNVPMLPTYATDIVEVCPWHNSVVGSHLQLVPAVFPSTPAWGREPDTP